MKFSDNMTNEVVDLLMLTKAPTFDLVLITVIS